VTCRHRKVQQLVAYCDHPLAAVDVTTGRSVITCRTMRGWAAASHEELWACGLGGSAFRVCDIAGYFHEPSDPPSTASIVGRPGSGPLTQAWLHQQQSAA
jgi:hypothetical protein